MSIHLLIHSANQKLNLCIAQVGSQIVAGLLFLVLSAILSSCGIIPTDSLSQVTNVPSKAMVEDVPFYPQDELQCGPAALAMVLNWSGVSILPSELSSEVYSPGLQGSLQSSIIGSARRHGRVAYTINGSDHLLEELSAGHPVIVLVNLSFSWLPKWHYAVVIGYDQQQEEVVLHSGLNKGEILSFWKFMNIWKRSDYWGLLVLPPDQMPKSVEEKKWLEAVSGLENTKQWQAAAIGYAAALDRWNESFVAWMGLGNSKYNLHDLKVSEKAFNQATLLQPQNGMAFNNLAHVLAKQGKLQDALIAAQHAVELGGHFKETFIQTLEEIKVIKTN